MRNIFMALLCITVGFTSCAQKKRKASKKQPNIIYIMSDDHTTQGFGVYGSRLASLNPTPTIDRIGNEGIIFDNAFCTNSICTPSRATIMTGQYGQVNNVKDTRRYHRH